MIDENIKISIIYFSPTGNSERIAEKIRRFFQGRAVCIDVSLYENKKSGEPLTCDILFSVCPVYSQSCPDEFLKILKHLNSGCAAVPCVTYGSVHAGKALYAAAKILEKKGCRILAGAEFAVQHSYRGTIKKGKTTPIDAELKEEAAVAALCEKAIERYYDKGQKPIKFSKRANPFSVFAKKFRAKLSVKKPRADKKLCINCNKCKTGCAFNAINEDLTVNGKCNRCGACVAVCPHKARKLFVRPITRAYLNKYYDATRQNIIY